MATQKALFFQALQAQFTTIFTLSLQKKDNSAARLRTQGFIQAGELLAVCERHEVQQLMEQAHFDVFGCSIAERQPEKTRRAQALKNGDDDYFDEPACNRLR